MEEILHHLTIKWGWFWGPGFVYMFSRTNPMIFATVDGRDPAPPWMVQTLERIFTIFQLVIRISQPSTAMMVWLVHASTSYQWLKMVVNDYRWLVIVMMMMMMMMMMIAVSKMEDPHHGWFIVKNPIHMDDLGIP